MSAIHCIHEITINNGIVMSLFIAGLVGGATHCTFMCGPFVVSQTSNDNDLLLRKESFLFPYHLGRTTTYVFLAFLINSLLNADFIHNELRAYIVVPMLMLSIIYFISSVYPNLSGLFPWLYNMKPLLPMKLLTSISSSLMRHNNVMSRYLLGVTLGFLPCGLVFAALLASSSAPDISMAMLSMLAFSIGTMPALMAVSLSANKITRTFPSMHTTLKKCSMMLSSIFLIVIVITIIS